MSLVEAFRIASISYVWSCYEGSLTVCCGESSTDYMTSANDCSLQQDWHHQLCKKLDPMFSWWDPRILKSNKSELEMEANSASYMSPSSIT